MPTTIKAALKKWEEASGKKSSESREIKLIGVYPPIEKMEGPLHILVNCEKLSLSTNLISQIQNLQVLKNLKVLSLGRNLIKSLQVGRLPKVYLNITSRKCLTYRVFIKYCVFSFEFCDFSELCQFCRSTGVLSAISRFKREVRYTHTDTKEKPRKARFRNIFF